MKKSMLLDTNALLFWFFESKRLSPVLKEIKKHHLFVSFITIWEISIKNQIGKLPLPLELPSFIAQIEGGFKLVDLQTEDIETYGKLPLHHRDPFDRMLISQAINRKFILLTADRQIDKYDMQKLIF